MSTNIRLGLVCWCCRKIGRNRSRVNRSRVTWNRINWRNSRVIPGRCWDDSDNSQENNDLISIANETEFNNRIIYVIDFTTNVYNRPLQYPLYQFTFMLLCELLLYKRRSIRNWCLSSWWRGPLYTLDCNSTYVIYRGILLDTREMTNTPIDENMRFIRHWTLLLYKRVWMMKVRGKVCT